MKKMIFCGMVLFLALAAAVFASRDDIEEAVQAYETIVVEAEGTAQKEFVYSDDITGLEQKAEAAGPKIEAVMNEPEWTIQDTRRLVDLNARFSTAMAAIAQNIMRY